MKTIFDKAVRDALIARINALDGHSRAQWGKMSVYQMLKHCTLWDAMMQGGTRFRQTFIGRLFGRMALKSVLKDEHPLRRQTPTIPELTIKGNGDAASQKEEWIARIRQYEHFSNPDFVHVFFGKMSTEQIGYLAYKHADHHLRQFNA